MWQAWQELSEIAEIALLTPYKEVPIPRQTAFQSPLLPTLNRFDPKSGFRRGTKFSSFYNVLYRSTVFSIDSE